MTNDGSRRKGQWTEERNIGSGGFGAVALWKNVQTGDCLALKKCRLANEMTEKHKKRWQMEVKIMSKLDHENVIAGLDVPSELDVRPNELPLLAMEYCSGGDLRRILNQPEHCLGLKEFSIRCLTRDISSGLEYLHGNRIIHRDLKPENIVLKPAEERVIYKIIDLGYAKELDQGSVCTSFVGTLQYLAPELFASQKYTCTVDYWSFGTVVFECITGYRPFLPDLPPVQWHKEICKKSPDDICAIVDDKGEVKFHRTIPSKCKLARSMQVYMEQWLRMMLRWDPKARGGGLNKEGRPACFSILDSIFNMKIIYLLNVATNELETYPIADAHNMSDLQKRIEQETNISVEEQDIVMANGMTPDPDKPASQCYLEPSEQDCFVYLFRHGGGDFQPEQSINRQLKQGLPKSIQTIVKDMKTMLPFQEQKRTWAESVVFCDEVFQLFKRLVLSQRAIMLSLLRSDSQFVRMKNKMIAEKEVLATKIKYFQESLEHDVMFYNEQVNNGGVSSDRMYSKWMRMAQDVDEFKKLEQRVNDLEAHAVALQTRIVELQKSPFARTKQDDTLEELAKQAKKVYEDFRKQARENRDEIHDHKPIVNIIVKAVMWRDKKLPDLFAHLGKICGCKADLNTMLPQIDSCVQEITINSKKIVDFQKQRQTAVWRLVEIAVQQGKGNSPLDNQDNTDMGDIPTMCRQDLSGSGRSPVGIPQGNPFPVLNASPMGTQMAPMGNFSQSGNSSMLQSLMSSTLTDSVQALEESKVTNKQMETALGELFEEQEQFTTKLTDINKTLHGRVPNS
ncbi:inhibitor of nuclear factor kappa-B kinase subunit alpha-like [Mya arenaria]|uniref:inhibitor of nuclear factor kappa-B kinase subunit alpha-like n=1 Tax=Mya arenaria TaxID=6604 RepID=UPI0022E2C30C|nr:inhibitor of nuclear factor kappa-B kinase subunit alpha-like [Mya arenaria]XP_052780374.1 inhibitor of nuclear factor kappa-B kinase subunit alpha-like [Mya arenaria]XP_052780383.1 inhibitor of nuclear factor kappa-B kinase subunit alpha-like [Mya arenaria]XP_052780392.1 inhibitor of nuclear factor kappa-B kinase subunit alpha-like [Mya arenaria]XP_052780401.1 inhibitor of nuclear factor kappa-B kinase subunit alpha-like [Mya arenaria]XP_052780410.1 inhibitor of nuclear factor kappa-B kina